MQLLVNGASLRIARMGPDELLVDSGVAHPPGPAVIQLQVDDNERRWEVYLPNGIAVGQMQPAAVTLPSGQTQRQNWQPAQAAESQSR